MSNHHDHGPLDPDLLAPEARRELLGAYLDGELGAEQALQVSNWLDDHPQALREVEHHRLAWDLLEHYEDEPVPAAFADQVFAAVGIAPAGRRAPAAGEGTVLRLAWYRRPLATAAAVLVAVGATVFVMRDRPAAETPTPISTTDVVAVLEDVPADQLDELLLNADVLLNVDADVIDIESAVTDLDDEVVLGG